MHACFITCLQAVRSCIYIVLLLLTTRSGTNCQLMTFAVVGMVYRDFYFGKFAHENMKITFSTVASAFKVMYLCYVYVFWTLLIHFQFR